MPESMVATIAELGDYIWEKIDKRALRDIFDPEITKASLEHGMNRIEDEVLKPMEKFILLVRSYK